jgi:chromosome segregation ATPase
MEKLAKICTKYDLDIQKLPDYNISIKANSALSELSKDYHVANNNWNENESHRRRLESKFTKLSTNLKDSQAAKNYWEQKINSDFDELLVDANRVASGGPSSRQLSRNRKQTNLKRRG